MDVLHLNDGARQGQLDMHNSLYRAQDVLDVAGVILPVMAKLLEDDGVRARAGRLFEGRDTLAFLEATAQRGIRTLESFAR